MDGYRLYDVSLSPDHPSVEMLVAAVETARQAGSRVLVIGSPIPVEELQARGLYHPESFATLHTAVEEHGGSFLDLHRALASRDYRDSSGHYTGEGASRIAELVTPAVETALRQEGTPVDG